MKHIENNDEIQIKSHTEYIDLDEAIRYTLDLPGNAPIPVQELQHIRKLTVNYCTLYDLTGLEHLPNLTVLYLDNNASISDISALKKMTNLETLYLSINSISDISALRDLTNLTMLELSRNSVSDISALKNLTKLKTLVLSDNSVSDISALKKMTNLEMLWLSDNNISDVSALEGLTNLKTLGIPYNNISDISALKKMTNLTELYLTENNIRDISALKNLTNLETLRLSGNPIEDTSPIYHFTLDKLTNVDIAVSQEPPSVNKSRFNFTYQDWSLLPDENDMDSIHIAEQGAIALNELLTEIVDVIVESNDIQRAVMLYRINLDDFGPRYSSVGIGDSAVREKLFSKVTLHAGIEYIEIYTAWLNY